MEPYIAYIADFLQDTCVVVVFAYLLSRATSVRALLRERVSLREAFILGSILGAIGLGEKLVPQLSFKYASESLCLAFAATIGGLPVALITSIILLAGILMESPRNAIGLIPAVAVGVLLAPAIRRAPTLRLRLWRGFFMGSLVQATRLVVALLIRHIEALPGLAPAAFLDIPADGIGLVLLLLVISDAQERADSERRRLEMEQQRADAERANALAAEAQLSALRARIHPHFLFNALNSIAELCYVAPKRAEQACINLSRLMRRVLETSVARVIPFAQEREMIESYLDIERERLGERLSVVYQIAPGSDTLLLIPFSVEVLVENAINHGLMPKVGPGTVTIVVRRSARRTLIAVRDDGIGMPPGFHPLRQEVKGQPTHGLQILNQHLVLHYGPAGRLRFFSRAHQGTLALFAIPVEQKGNPK